MNLVIIGSTGQVGQALLRCCRRDWVVHALTRHDLDMSKPATIEPMIQSLKPDVIVNASGYTAVDRAEQEPQLARLVNAEAVSFLARAARSIGASLVHYSTDYVFDGTSAVPYAPDDPPNPKSAYARSKRDGEVAIIESGAKYLVLRTQWVYGLTGRNFVLAILKQALRSRELRVVNDQVGTPTWSLVIAQATVDIISKGIDEHQGVYHLACSGSTNWCEFAHAVFEEAKSVLPAMRTPQIIPVSTAEYGTAAMRPRYSVLDCTKTEQTFGIQSPHWRPTLHRALSDAESLKRAMSTAAPPMTVQD